MAVDGNRPAVAKEKGTCGLLQGGFGMLFVFWNGPGATCPRGVKGLGPANFKNRSK